MNTEAGNTVPDLIRLTDPTGREVFVDREVLRKAFTDNAVTLFGMRLGEIADLRRMRNMIELCGEPECRGWSTPTEKLRALIDGLITQGHLAKHYRAYLQWIVERYDEPCSGRAQEALDGKPLRP